MAHKYIGVKRESKGNIKEHDIEISQLGIRSCLTTSVSHTNAMNKDKHDA